MADPNPWVTLVSQWVIAILYLTAGWAGTGRTVGKNVMGLRVISANGARLGAARAFLRAVICATLGAIALLTIVISRKRSGIHDYHRPHDRGLRLDPPLAGVRTPSPPRSYAAAVSQRGTIMSIERDDQTLSAAVADVARVWWVVLVFGIVFLGFGIVMLFNVAAGATAIAIIVGAFLIFDGLVEMISGGRRGGSRGWAVVLGILLVIGGVVVIAWPGVTFLVIAIVWGLTMLVGGIARSIAAATLRGYGWGWLILLGILEAILGVLMLAWPDVTAYVILLLIGIYSIIAGILQIVLSFQLRKAPERLARLAGGSTDIVF